jgi:hypothetical protein
MKISRSVKKKKEKNPVERVQNICLGKNVPKSPYFDQKQKKSLKSQNI